MLLLDIIFFGFLISLFVNKQVWGDNSSEVSDRIFNGKNAEIGERPYQVSLQNPTPFCGGTIVNSRYILTAAHCLDGQTASKIKVIVGTVDLRKPYKTYRAQKIIINKDYNPSNSFKNDIALLKVFGQIQFSARVKAVTFSKRRIKTGTTVIVSGWGTLENGELSNHLQEVVLQVTDQQKCRNAVRKEKFNLFNTQLCADDNDPTVRSGDCNGDSGGPLTSSNGVLVGIVSWSIKDPSCGSNKYPNVYTRVSDYIDWIKHPR